MEVRNLWNLCTTYFYSFSLQFFHWCQLFLFLLWVHTFLLSILWIKEENFTVLKKKVLCWSASKSDLWILHPMNINTLIKWSKNTKFQIFSESHNSSSNFIDKGGYINLCWMNSHLSKHFRKEKSHFCHPCGGHG